MCYKYLNDQKVTDDNDYQVTNMMKQRFHPWLNSDYHLIELTAVKWS